MDLLVSRMISWSPHHRAGWEIGWLVAWFVGYLTTELVSELVG